MSIQKMYSNIFSTPTIGAPGPAMFGWVGLIHFAFLRDETAFRTARGSREVGLPS